MSLFSFFKPKPKPSRSRISGEQSAMLLKKALQGRTAPNYRHVGTKRIMAITTREMVRAASDRSYKPWVRDAWECEDQARALVDELQKMAAREGCSHDCGILIGKPFHDDLADEVRDYHVWVWALVESSHVSATLAFFDATAREWADAYEFEDVHLSMT